MLSYTELKKGILFVLNGEPYEVLESNFLRMQQRKAVMQSKIRNLITRKIIDRNWQASDYLEEAEVEKRPALFIYSRRGECWFTEPGNPKHRYSLPENLIGEAAKFLIPDTTVETIVFKEKVIKISLPIKMDFEVKEAPPALRGNTAQGGTKAVVIKEGVTITVPLFVEQGDIIRVNTETGEYVERVEKKTVRS